MHGRNLDGKRTSFCARDPGIIPNPVKSRGTNPDDGRGIFEILVVGVIVRICLDHGVDDF